MLELLEQILARPVSPEARIWTALAPALVFSAYFLGGFALYLLIYTARGKSYHDEELSTRARTALTNRLFRMFFAWLMQPLWRFILWTGVPANAITTLSVLLATGSGVALSAGRFALGGWLYIISGILDFIDGRLARARGDQSASGAALDSILDRYADAATLIGMAWYFRDSWVLLVVMAAMAGSSFVPYIRAKGEIAGINMTVGIMQRAERIMYLGIAVALSPVLEAVMAPNVARPPHRLAVIGVVLIAISTQLTAAHRLVHLLQALGGRDLSQSWISRQRGVWVPVLGAATLSTGCDYALRFSLLALGFAGPVLVVPAGSLLGAMVNFSLARLLSFAGKGVRPNGKRAVFIALSSAAFNTGGVALVLSIPDVPPWLAWLCVNVAVFITWNFPLREGYLFRRREAGKHPAIAEEAEGEAKV